MTHKGDSLGDRMKTYESVSRHFLTRRTPVVIRLDGCHFHTFTRGFDKPFDNILCQAMQETMKNLCKNIQGCVLGYTQSDEITLVLCDYKKLTSDAWFSNNIQKMASISASLATIAFNSSFKAIVVEQLVPYTMLGDESYVNDVMYRRLMDKYLSKADTATFDSRVFNLPKEEVCNCLIWRQQDATRNSIQGLGQKYFSHKQLEGKNCNNIQDMLMVEHSVNWNDVETKFKRGSCCIKGDDGWVIDNEIPIFTKDRDYVERRINFD